MVKNLASGAAGLVLCRFCGSVLRAVMWPGPQVRSSSRLCSTAAEGSGIYCSEGRQMGTRPVHGVDNSREPGLDFYSSRLGHDRNGTEIEEKAGTRKRLRQLLERARTRFFAAGWFCCVHGRMDRFLWICSYIMCAQATKARARTKERAKARKRRAGRREFCMTLGPSLGQSARGVKCWPLLNVMQAWGQKKRRGNNAGDDSKP